MFGILVIGLEIKCIQAGLSINYRFLSGPNLKGGLTLFKTYFPSGILAQKIAGKLPRRIDLKHVSSPVIPWFFEHFLFTSSSYRTGPFIQRLNHKNGSIQIMLYRQIDHRPFKRFSVKAQMHAGPKTFRNPPL